MYKYPYEYEEIRCSLTIMCSCFMQHLETVIKSRIPGIQSLISKSIAELESELSRLGKPIAADAGVSFLVVLGNANFLLLESNLQSMYFAL